MRLLAQLLFVSTCVTFGAHGSPSTTGLQRRVEDTTENIDEWQATVKRASSSVLRPCPVSCTETKNVTSTNEWYLVSDASKLALCNETMLLDMAVKGITKTDDISQTIVRACTADYESTAKIASTSDQHIASLCTTANRVLEETTVYVQQLQLANDALSTNHLLSAGQHIINHLRLQTPSCSSNAMEFAFSQSSAMGVFIGAEVHQYEMMPSVLAKFLEYATRQSISRTTIAQICGIQGRGADYSIGIVVTSLGNVPLV